MKYYLKQIILPFVYLVCLGFSQLAIDLIGVPWVEVLVAAIMLFFFSYLMILIFFREGQAALKVRDSNDMLREYMVKTGKPVEIKAAEEYKWYKPIIFGLIISLPLIVVCIIHFFLVLFIGAEADGAAIVGRFIYMIYYEIFLYAYKPLVGWEFFYLLTFIPYICAILCVPYYFGMKKAKRQADEIKEKQRILHGEEN